VANPLLELAVQIKIKERLATYFDDLFAAYSTIYKQTRLEVSWQPFPKASKNLRVGTGKLKNGQDLLLNLY
jgi:hypothetical protein